MPRLVGYPTKYKGRVLIDSNGTRLVVEAMRRTLDQYRTLLCCYRENARGAKYLVPLESDGSLPPWFADSTPVDPLPTSSWQSRKN